MFLAVTVWRPSHPQAPASSSSIGVIAFRSISAIVVLGSIWLLIKQSKDKESRHKEGVSAGEEKDNDSVC